MDNIREFVKIAQAKDFSECLPAMITVQEFCKTHVPSSNEECRELVEVIKGFFEEPEYFLTSYLLGKPLYRRFCENNSSPDVSFLVMAATPQERMIAHLAIKGVLAPDDIVAKFIAAAKQKPGR
jgi:hypothetical protein